MFVGSLVAAIAASTAVLFLMALQIATPQPPPPPPPGQGGQGGGGGGGGLLTPHALTSAIVIVAGIAVVAWVATIAAMARDQILRDLNRVLSEYAEMRETDGFLNGLRQASRPDADVRQLHPVRPID